MLDVYETVDYGFGVELRCDAGDEALLWVIVVPAGWDVSVIELMYTVSRVNN